MITGKAMTLGHEITERLAYTAPFSGFSMAEREALTAVILVKDYPPDAIILEQGCVQHEHLFWVLSGQLRLIETTMGSVTRTFGEGKLFGHYGLLRGGPLPYQAETLTEVQLALIPADSFHRLCRQHPRVLAYFESDIRAYTRHHVTLYDLSGAQFLFGTRLGDLIQGEAPHCRPETTVQDAAKIMSDGLSDHLVVMGDTAPIGLVTDGDLRRKVVAAGASTEMPISQVMSGDLGFLSPRNSLYDALLAMLKKDLTHVLVRATGTGPLLGVVGQTDIARCHGYNPMLLLRQGTNATTLDQLSELRREANRQLLQLYRRGVRAQDLVTINTLINDNLTERVLTLGEAALAEDRPEVAFRWAWLSMGSEGRGEMSLKTDQDNALVYQAPGPALPVVDAWLARWAAQVNKDLDRVGLSLCEGGMMAGNPQWRHPVEQWPEQFDAWLAQSEAMQIMQVAAACDLRAVHGDLALEEPVKKCLAESLANNPRFLRHMARGVISARPPVGSLFRRIRTVKTDEGNVINIKRRGLQPITDFARVLALRRKYLESSNTFDRLEYLLQAEPKLEGSLQDALDAYRHLNDIRLGHQLYDVSMGLQPSNWISVDKLSDTQHEMLKAAFRSIETIQAVLAQRY